MTKKAYNVVATQIDTANKGKNANGKAKITFHAKLTVGKGDKAREITRTVVAQGLAADLIAGMVRKGKQLPLRVIFDRAPNNADGSKGGEFLTVVGLPNKKAA